MGLYNSFNPSDYYDDDEKPAKVTPVKTQRQEVTPTPLQPEVRKSLYDQAKQIATSKSEDTGPDYRDIYRVGQAVMVQGSDVIVRTSDGIIAEIVAKNLMYVYMQDSYKDATDQWLADFVTTGDIITPL